MTNKNILDNEDVIWRAVVDQIQNRIIERTAETFIAQDLAGNIRA